MKAYAPYIFCKLENLKTYKVYKYFIISNKIVDNKVDNCKTFVGNLNCGIYLNITRNIIYVVIKDARIEIPALIYTEGIISPNKSLDNNSNIWNIEVRKSDAKNNVNVTSTSIISLNLS